MRAVQLLLFPLAILYGFVTCIRNLLYNSGILKSCKSTIPSICVGNLSYGGTGKTPHVEYLIRLLQSSYKITTLSRGYGRKTSGFITADIQSSSIEIGDEPRQYKQKFNDLTITVCESRCKGAKQIAEKHSSTDVIILDDAFQHRPFKAGLSIVLTDYYKMYTHDYLLPSGTLRETRAGANRADIIIVTKTPRVFSPITRKTLLEELKPKPQQKVYFSYITYGEKVVLTGTLSKTDITKTYAILVFAGIANMYPLIEHVRRMCTELEIIKFADHHQYNEKDVNQIKETFNNIVSRNKIIITSEKDAMRFDKPELVEIIKDLPVFYIPIEIDFHKEDKESFNNQIQAYVRKNKTNNGIHPA